MPDEPLDIAREGIETRMTAAHLMRFRDGRLSQWRLCETSGEALRQVRSL